MKRPRLPKIDRENLHEWFIRGTLLLIAVLFLGTALVGGIYYFWADQQQAKQDKTQTAKLAGKPLAGFTPIKDVSKLQTIDLKKGTGKAVKSNSTLTVLYTGAVAATGVVFESSADSGQPATFPLSGVIKGWQQGMLGMKEGGQRRLLIPAELAYGPQAKTGIPANSDLVFDVTLLSVK